MKFIVDAQLPPALAWALREAGHDAQAVRELGLRQAEDSEIWDYALANNAAIVTKDQDFAERLLAGKTAPESRVQTKGLQKILTLRFTPPYWCPGVIRGQRPGGSGSF